jgi:hypothetical protein
VKFTYSLFREVLDDADQLQCLKVNIDFIAQGRTQVAPDGRGERFVAHYPTSDEAPACAAIRGCALDEAYPGLLLGG